MLNIISIAYTVTVLSFFLAFVFSSFAKNITDNFIGIIMGFTGGLLLAFICFEILPVAFITWGLYFSIGGIILGVIFCVFTENFIDRKKVNYDNRLYKTGILLGLGIALHNIPEGIALGAMLKLNFDLGLKLSLFMGIHCLPEALALCISLRKSGISKINLLIFALIFGLPMAFGSFFGAIFSSFSAVLVAFSLSFAGGVMLYISCGQIIPDAKDYYNSKLTTVISCFGFIAGLMIINYL